MKASFFSLISIFGGIAISACGATPGEDTGASAAAISASDLDAQCRAYGGTPAAGGCSSIQGGLGGRLDIPSEFYVAVAHFEGIASIGLPLAPPETCATPPGVPVPEVPCQRFQRATIEHHAYDHAQPYKIGLIGRDWLNTGASLAVAEMSLAKIKDPDDKKAVDDLRRQITGGGSSCFSASNGLDVERHSQSHGGAPRRPRARDLRRRDPPSARKTPRQRDAGGGPEHHRSRARRCGRWIHPPPQPTAITLGPRDRGRRRRCGSPRAARVDTCP